MKPPCRARTYPGNYLGRHTGYALTSVRHGEYTRKLQSQPAQWQVTAMQTREHTAVSTFDRVAADLAHAQFLRVGAALRARTERILKQWRSLSLKAMPHSAEMTRTQFEDAVAAILSAAADAFESADPQKLRGVVDEAPVHGIDRFAQECSLLDLFEEVRILRGVVIVELADEMQRPLSPGEAATFHAVFDIIVQQGAMALVHRQGEELQQL